MVWTVRERLTDTYPYSAMEMAKRVVQRVPGAKVNMVWKTIADHDLKNDKRYAAYNFRNRTQERAYLETGVIPSVTPTIYNDAAIDFVVEVLADAGTEGATIATT